MERNTGNDVKSDSRSQSPDSDLPIITSSGHRHGRLHRLGENDETDEREMMLVTSSGHSRSRSHSHSHHGHRPHRHQMKRGRKVLVSAACVVLSLAIVLTGVVFALWYKGGTELTATKDEIAAPSEAVVEEEDSGSYVTYNGRKYKLDENIVSILLIGVDNRDLDGDEESSIGTAGQADLNILMAIDTSTGDIKLINISRDSMVEVNQYSTGGSFMGTAVEQLCLAYTFGDGRETSCENQVRTVERMFYNLSINSYFALDLDGIAAVNDCIGGVDVVSPETIDVFTEGESYHLEGELAEKFVRRRDTKVTDSNLDRNERQKTYINAFVKKVKSLNQSNVVTAIDLFNASSDYSCTNLNASRITYLAGVAMANDLSYEIMSVPGEYKQGERYAEYYVDYDEFYEMFLDVFYDPVDE